MTAGRAAGPPTWPTQRSPARNVVFTGVRRRLGASDSLRSMADPHRSHRCDRTAVTGWLLVSMCVSSATSAAYIASGRRRSEDSVGDDLVRTISVSLIHAVPDSRLWFFIRRDGPTIQAPSIKQGRTMPTTRNPLIDHRRRPMEHHLPERPAHHGLKNWFFVALLCVHIVASMDGRQGLGPIANVNSATFGVFSRYFHALRRIIERTRLLSSRRHFPHKARRRVVPSSALLSNTHGYD